MAQARPGTRAADSQAIFPAILAAAQAHYIALREVRVDPPTLGMPATWVQGWMGFPAGQRSISDLPSNFWSRFIDASGSTPGQLSGGIDIMLLIVASLAASTWIFRRTDVAG